MYIHIHTLSGRSENGHGCAGGGAGGGAVNICYILIYKYDFLFMYILHTNICMLNMYICCIAVTHMYIYVSDI